MKFARNLILTIIAMQSPLAAIAVENVALAHGQPELFPYLTFEGVIRMNFAMANVGYGLIQENGKEIQLDLRTNNLENEWVPGAKVRVSGPYKDLRNAGSRRIKILEVEKFESLQVRDESLSGTMETVRAIGGETTGYGLRLANGSLVEIDLRKNNKQGSFNPGMVALISGSFETIQGPTRGPRDVFVVSQIAIQ